MKKGKGKYGAFLIAIILVALVPFAISFFLFWMESGPFYAVIPNPNEWIALASGLLAYIGTCFIGLLTIWQNIRFKSENDKSQERLNTFNQRLLNVEEKRVEPVFDIVFENKWSCGGELRDNSSFEIYFVNIGETPILYMNIKDIIGTIKETAFYAEDVYIGGLASKAGCSKKILLKGALFSHEEEVEFRFTADYKDILGNAHRKKVVFIISGKSDRRAKIISLDIQPIKIEDGQ